jgi:hypothetical protein
MSRESRSGASSPWRSAAPRSVIFPGRRERSTMSRSSSMPRYSGIRGCCFSRSVRPDRPPVSRSWGSGPFLKHRWPSRSLTVDGQLESPVRWRAARAVSTPSLCQISPAMRIGQVTISDIGPCRLQVFWSLALLQGEAVDPSMRSRNVGELWGRRGWFACASSRKLQAVMGRARGGKPRASLLCVSRRSDQ